jgi:serine/threonine protein kinase
MKPPEPTPAALHEELPDSAIASAARALPAGSCLDEFEIGEIIGEGSATIVYAATYRARGVPVAIAEYMPARIALRNDAAQVVARTSAQADAFAKGLKAFIDETHTLARCDHPSLVRIVRSWEAHATAYRVMPRYPAMRLLEVRRDMTEPPGEDAVRALLDAMLGALGAFHHAGGFHGKVTPFNILLRADNRPLLLAPGAADRAIAGDRIDALITSSEPSFAPIEQIVESADVPLPLSVDLYALAGVARYWITGQLPAPACGAPGTARRERLADTARRLSLTWPRLHYSESLLNALESALSIYPAERPQSVAEMRARLDAARPPAAGPVSGARTPAPTLHDGVPSSPAAPTRAAQDVDAAVAFAPGPGPIATRGVTGIDDQPSARTVFARQVSNTRHKAMWSSAVVVLLALLPIGMYAFHQERQIGRVLDVLGISRGTGEGAAVSASGVGPPAPAPPPTTADAGSAKSMPTEPAAADAGGANSMPTKPAAAESSASAIASESPANGDRATPATADTSAPPIVVQPPAPKPPPTRVARQNASRVPASPRATCGARTGFALYRCMQLECGRRQWISHPQCERLRTNDSVD